MDEHFMFRKTELKTEKVVQQQLGYLKVPSAFKDHYGSPTHYPEPEKVWMSDFRGKIYLIYEFDAGLMNELKND